MRAAVSSISTPVPTGLGRSDAVSGGDDNRSTIATAVGLLIFAAAFLWAVTWNAVDGKRSPVDRELAEIAATVEGARACNLPETAIARFVKARLTLLRERHPQLGASEIVGDLLRRAKIDAVSAPKDSATCARLSERLAAA
jgi:hypothetical protein